MSSQIHRPASVQVTADSPVEAMWTYYRGLETPQAAERMLGSSIPPENLIAARDTIRQARAYFSAARTSPLLTRPVLDYYGMVSLGKLVLLLDRENPLTLSEIEAMERKGHGLKEHDGTDADGNFFLESCEVEVTADVKAGASTSRGVFPFLARSIAGAETSRWLGKRCSVLALVQSIPQLEAILTETLGAEATYRGCAVQFHTYADGRAELVTNLPKAAARTVANVESRAPYLATLGASLAEVPGHDGVSQVRVRFDERGTAYSVARREEFSRDAATLPPEFQGTPFYSILASYMLMYALSIVARYKPHRWATILDGQSSRLLPAIEAYVAVTERWWPNLILNHLTGKWILFSQPSYW